MKIRYIHSILAICISGMALMSGCGNMNNNQESTEEPLGNTQELYPLYAGDDLGATYRPGKTLFKVWAPTAELVLLRTYKNGAGGPELAEIEMVKGPGGVWETSVEGDQEGIYYTYQAQIGGNWMDEVPDPYAEAVGVNGRRAMVVDLAALQPEGWSEDEGIRPDFQDIILYEAHVRDFTVGPGSGIRQKGKFAGVAEYPTSNPKSGSATGISHLKELDITHVHLLPSFDHQSIDETRLDSPQYNWGYDPLNYNVPEGSYSTDPADGHVRIREFREMVKSLHAQGIGVILDVVYNHTGATENSIFNQLVPGYYYRKNEDGSFSNASGCGNETASDQPMMRKYILQSVRHWVENYHIDGFRFDLMGIHDIETMNAIRKELDQIDPKIFLYGEGWTAGGSPLDESLRAVKKNTRQLDRVAAFCDDMRDAIKGHWADKKDNGFVSGKKGQIESIKFGLFGAIQSDHIAYDQVNYSDAGWANDPTQCINYVACHDDLCLRDKLRESTQGLSQEEIKRMHRLANGLVLLGQGVPFLHAGAEMFRTKQGDHNSYKSPDAINQIDWNWKDQHQAHFEYFRQLIQLRKAHPSFRLGTAERVEKHFAAHPFEVYGQDSLAFGFRITGIEGDPWQDIRVIVNAQKSELGFDLDVPYNAGFDGSSEKQFYFPEGKGNPSTSWKIPPQSIFVLFRTTAESSSENKDK